MWLLQWTARPDGLCTVNRGVFRTVHCPLWRGCGTGCHVWNRTGRAGVGCELVQRGVASFVVGSHCSYRGLYTWCVL